MATAPLSIRRRLQRLELAATARGASTSWLAASLAGGRELLLFLRDQGPRPPWFTAEQEHQLRSEREQERQKNAGFVAGSDEALELAIVGGVDNTSAAASLQVEDVVAYLQGMECLARPTPTPPRALMQIP